MAIDESTLGQPVETEQGERDDSLLRRWSARKFKARQEAERPSSAIQAEPAASPAVVAELTDADMPPLETLDEQSDYSPFLAPKVSALLRRQALRKLFHSPAFNVTDGLDDYAEDYTRFAELGSVVTQEMRHRLEVLARQAEPTPGQTRLDQDSQAAQSRAEDKADTGALGDTRIGDPESLPSDPDTPTV
ncbi:MAG: DUF3306 domain-containing protein [Gammaproteobacteria bacterium]|nr:DUF3306 domain-containing protein [Gammaproteobacteria bacterium]MCP5425781.1 DUF3306 domain-containing protein [Gammaproteobacteria bacterium]MCP5458608.1 DUF3306 domain-containing protein [Gammaproteobacteria bacterium]